ncbi:TetR/AcrR family transcriptional repressor of mexJK operon [Hamadaea flava]|uniref:TetR/AcrR family transcriptional regulator n=1 Tax=Hamadaea flava TaxID=1742688 RepID=A0ABV8LJE0_9ACTN|nr:TetR/AcrR family transcriptional regulator [Hamadaea flava]MCP2323527.1 TetR/AcrR family transcriptional repressor of mexJK operon [Hamadaea flava]
MADERPQEEGRSARKRSAILEAATELFLCNGYQGTSMDEIAAVAAVSKQTVYKNFTDKEQLFGDIILGATDRVGEFVDVITAALAETEDLERDLGLVARRYIATVIQPRVLQLRRLLIAEAGRFPDLARAYYQRAPERTITALAACFQDLADRGLLRLDDAHLAANHFAWLILSTPMDKAMFHEHDEPFTAAELERFADEGVRVFLAAYRRA